MAKVTPAPELTVQEAAQWLGLSPDQIRRLCDNGTLVHRRVGHGWRLIPREAVETLAVQRANRSKTPPTK